jgi:hypothetical protein
MKGKRLPVLLFMALIIAALGLGGCAAVQKDWGLGCCQPMVESIAPEAELVSLTCEQKKFDGVDSVWFHVAIKNISQSDQRFRINIFLDNGKGVGGLLPRKTKKGLVKPGAVAKFSYPAKGVAQIPAEMMVIIKTVSK